MKFIASTLIFILLQLPVMLASFVIVPFMLRTKWTGRTTWFGNWKYGRGAWHYKYPANTFWRQWRFLCIRNPVSNFGKRVIAVKDAPWVWLHDQKIIGRFFWKYGWKDATPESAKRTFIYRPWYRRI